MAGQRQQHGDIETLNAKVAQVIPIAIQHSTDLTRPRDICSLLQVSTAVRLAMQQSRGHCCAYLSGCGMQETLHTVVGFCQWLPKHSGLVSELTVLKAGGQLITVEEPVLAAAGQLVLQAVQISVAKAATAVATSAQDGVQKEGSGDPLRLRLASFSTDFLLSPAMLPVLACAGLQQLQLTVSAGQLAPNILAALKELQGLQHAQLYVEQGEEQPQAEAAAVRKGLVLALQALPKLNSLSMHHLDAAAAAQLPATLQALTVLYPEQQQQEGEEEDSPVFDLHRLTNLQSLEWVTATGERFFRSPAPAVLLSAQAVRLSVTGGLALQGGHNLREVSLCADHGGDLELLQQLKGGKVHRLCLGIAMIFEASPDEKREAVEAIGRLQSVTALHFDDCHGLLVDPCVALCAQLAKLHLMCDLQLSLGAIDSEDILQLSLCTPLTSLRIQCESGFDDMAAVVCCGRLTGLQELQVCSYQLKTWAVLPIVAALPKLRHLSVSGSPELGQCLTAGVLQQLRLLTQLTYLGLPFGEACSKEARVSFRASMPGLMRLDDDPFMSV